MEKPSSDFFATLGEYVYQYRDGDESLYVGKGRGDRCWAHVNERGYEPEQCYIMARNLEKFNEKKDHASYLVESMLIVGLTPRDNAVAGHYKECFDEAPLSSLHEQYKSSLHDTFETLPEWFINNYAVFKGKLREVKINSSSVYCLSSACSKTYIMWWWNPTSKDPIKVTFESNVENDKEQLKHHHDRLRKWLKRMGYSDVRDDGKIQKCCIYVDTIEEVVKLFSEFTKEY